MIIFNLYYLRTVGIHATGMAFFMAAVFLSLGIGISSYYYYAATTAMENEISNITVQQAPQFANKKVYYFTNGQVNAMYIGQFRKSAKGISNVYCATPIVYANWSRSDPVPVWAFCYTHLTACTTAYSNRSSDCVVKWDQAKLTGVTVETASEGYAKDAVADAIKRFQLKSTPYAPIIYWDSPSNVFASWFQTYRRAIIIPNVIWFTLTVIYLPYFIYLRGRRSTYAKLEINSSNL